MLAKDDLGKDAIVMNIKTIRPRGIFKFFKKSTVEITAAVDEYKKGYEKQKEQVFNTVNTGFHSEAIKNNFESALEEETRLTKGEEALASSSIEMKLNNLQTMLEKQMQELSNKGNEEKQETNAENEVENFSLPWIQLIYNQLLSNEVDEKIVNEIIDEIEPTLKKDTTIDTILAVVYQKLILKLGQAQTLEFPE